MKNKNYKFPLIMLGSVLLGCLLGIILKDNVKYIKPLGEIFINMMYTIVVPLVFFTITSSIAKMSNLKRLSKVLKYVLVTFLVTSIISALIALVVVLNVDLVGSSNVILESSNISSSNILTEVVKAITVNDFINLFSKSNILPLIIFSSLLGVTLGLLRNRTYKIIDTFDTLGQVMIKFIKLIMYYAPIGICAYFASLVGEFGVQVMTSYTKTLAIYILISIFYYFIIYGLYAYISDGIRGVRNFFKYSFNSVITSLATQSSLATLPTNIDASKNLNIKEDVSNILLPLGSTIHMEGSVIGSIFKIFFLFSVFNIDITLSGSLIAIFISILSGIVMSGIPGGGLIGEALIINLYGFPSSAFPLIATIGWLIDAPATMLNSVGDLSSSMLVNKMIK